MGSPPQPLKEGLHMRSVQGSCVVFPPGVTQEGCGGGTIHSQNKNESPTDVWLGVCMDRRV